MIFIKTLCREHRFDLIEQVGVYSYGNRRNKKETLTVER